MVELMNKYIVPGLLVLLPILLLLLLVEEIIEFVIALATPIADLLPNHGLEAVNAQALLAIVLLALASLLMGLAIRLPPAQRFGHWLENHTVGRLPLYQTLKGFSSRLLGPDAERKASNPHCYAATTVNTSLRFSWND